MRRRAIIVQISDITAVYETIKAAHTHPRLLIGDGQGTIFLADLDTIPLIHNTIQLTQKTTGWMVVTLSETVVILSETKDLLFFNAAWIHPVSFDSISWQVSGDKVNGFPCLVNHRHFQDMDVLLLQKAQDLFFCGEQFLVRRRNHCSRCNHD